MSGTHRGQKWGGPYSLVGRNPGRGRTTTSYTIAIPAKIAEMVPEGAQFQPELTEEGILLRLVRIEEPSLKVPSWARKPEQRLGSVPDVGVL